jgi:CrcB protein
MLYIYLFLAGGLGVVARFATVQGIQRLFPTSLSIGGFPMGTLTVNILGSALFGFLTWYLTSRYASAQHLETLRIAILTGFLGGYTTFSAFSMEMLQLMQAGHIAKAITYALASVIICVLACFLGLILAKQLV